MISNVCWINCRTCSNATADWDVTMSGYHAQARRWSEKTYRRTSTYAADLRPMTRAALQKRGLM